MPHVKVAVFAEVPSCMEQHKATETRDEAEGRATVLRLAQAAADDSLEQERHAHQEEVPAMVRPCGACHGACNWLTRQR